MKRILILVAVFLLIPTVTLAQTKMEELGLKGPIKVMYESFCGVDANGNILPNNTIPPYPYRFSRNGKLQQMCYDPYARFFDSRERLIKDTSYEIEYDDHSSTFSRYRISDERKTLLTTGILNEKGNILKEIYRNNDFVKYSYDYEENLIYIEFGGAKRTTSIINYEYDNQNRLIHFKSDYMEHFYTYDPLTGFCTSKEIYEKDKPPRTIKYLYFEIDHVGNWTKRVELTDEEFLKTGSLSAKKIQGKKGAITVREIIYYQE